MRNRLTGRLSLLFLTFAVALLVFPAMAFAEVAAPDGTTSTSAPTIQSDLADYPPGATVTLTGSNWQPGESVHIYVNDDEGQTWSRNVDVTADASGNISDTFNLPDWFVATYKVTATGAQSGVATTSFTDGNLRFGTSTSAVEFDASWTRFNSSTNCSGAQATRTNGTGTVENSAGQTLQVGVSSTQSIQLTAPATEDGHTFSSWSGPGTFTVSNNGQTICVVGYDGSSNRLYVANYAPTPTNTAPVANNDSATTNEDNAINSINVLANDTDAQGNSLSVSSFTQPTNGTVTKNADNTIKYVPNANFNGTDTFTYKANDGTADSSNSGTVTITVNSVNDAPSFTKGADQTVNEDASAQTVTGWATAISSGPSNESTQTVSFTTTTNNNSLFSAQPQVSSNGTLTYTPAANASGTATVTVTAKDSGGTANGGLDTSASQTFTITINSVNDAPVANNDSAATNEDTAKDIAVLANDTDPEGDTLSVSSFTQPSNGTVSQNADGTLKYTPNADFNGSDSFTYKAKDASLDSNSATVSLTVSAVNDTPKADSQSVSTDEDTAKAITLTGSDADGNNLTYSVVSGPTHGTLSGTGANLTYTPNNNYNGSDSFTYKANDGTTDSNVATVSINVTAVNDAPVAEADTKTTDEDTPLTFPSSDLVGNDDEGAANESGQTLTVTEVFNGTHGTVVLQNGNITFTPEANFSGQATFDYRVCDNGSPSECSVETATVNVTINPVNDAPVAVNDSATTNEDTATNINVISNDTDVDNTNAQLSVSSFSQGTHGTVTKNADGTLKYTPNANYNGSDSFTYTVSDGNGGTDQGTVSITMTAVNDAPSFTAGANETVAEDSGPQTVPGWASGISAGPADESGQAVDFLVSNDNGTLFSVQPAVSPNGALTYTPAANASGTATVTVRAHDSGGMANGGVDTSASQTFTITVNAVNDNPVIASVTNNGPVVEGSPATIKVTANDAADGDTLSYAFDCDNNSTFEVGPQAASSTQCTFNDEGTYRVNVKVTDGNGGSATDSTSVVVNNAIPVIGPLTVTGNSGTACLGSTNVVKLSFSITDPGTSDTHSGTINWGDGTTTTFTGSSVTQQQHSYSAGTYNITVNASDNDGGTAIPKSTTGDQPSVSLRYNVSELQDPVNPTGMTMSVFKYGSTLPMRVLITDCNNQPVNGLVPRISFTKVNPATPTIGVNEGLSTQPNDTNFLMRDAGNGQYIYNLNTKTLPDGDATYNATITDSKATQTAPATYGPKVTQNFGLRSK